MTRKKLYLPRLAALALGLVLLCGCAAEKTNQTPLYAASNALRFAHNGDFAQFKNLFDETAEAQATEALFAELGATYTAAQTHETCHFVTTADGDVWLFRFAPADADGTWRITAVTRLSAGQADALGSLLPHDA